MSFLNEKVRRMLGGSYIEENTQGVFLACHKKLTGNDGHYYPSNSILIARDHVRYLIASLKLDANLNKDQDAAANTLNYLINKFNAFYMFKAGSGHGSIHDLFFFGKLGTPVTRVQANKIEKLFGIVDSTDRILCFNKFDFRVSISAGKNRSYSKIFRVE